MEYANVIITSPDQQKNWSGHLAHIPRIGETVTCREYDGVEIMFTGVVEDVHMEIRTAKPKMQVISVWLKEPD